LNIIQHLRAGDFAPLDNLRETIQRWDLNSQPYLVADTTFGNFNILDEITD